VSLLDPGSTVKVEAWRDGERREVKVKLGERPLQRLPGSG
jgi:S1-C subfamily serine protease